jgi:hypothetical protein
VAVILDALFTVKVVAGTSPNFTEVAFSIPVPFTATTVPPVVAPDDGRTLVTEGVAANVYRSALDAALVPPGPVTVTSTVAAEWVGVVAVIFVDDTTVNVVAAVDPSFTAVAPVKPDPVRVTTVPPVVVPEVGETAVTAGGAQ